MTDPIDDDGALRAALGRLPLVTGVDADELAGGAIRRGRQRRQRRRGAIASASALTALVLAVPALAATVDRDDPPVDVATEGDGHDGEPARDVEDGRDDAPRGEGPTTTVPDDEPKPPADDGDAEPDPVKPDDGAAPHEPPKDEPAPPRDKPKEEPPKEEPPKETPEVEALELWCGRGQGEEAGGVVCEVTLSEHPDFHAYRLVRVCADTPDAGWTVAAEWGQRTMPDRPWPDIRFFDPDGSPEFPWHYKVVVVDEAGRIIGVSNKVTIAAASPEGGDGGGGGVA